MQLVDFKQARWRRDIYRHTRGMGYGGGYEYTRFVANRKEYGTVVYVCMYLPTIPR